MRNDREEGVGEVDNLTAAIGIVRGLSLCGQDLTGYFFQVVYCIATA